MKAALACILFGSASAAAGQAGWILTPQYEPGQTSENPQHPRVRILATAYFPPQDYAVAGLNWNLQGTEPGWFGTQWIRPPFTLDGDGVVSGPSVIHIIAGQLNFPGAQVFADPRNPIPAWTVWWTTSDFRRREIDVRSRTAHFDVYPERLSPNSQSRMSVVVEGSLRIRVTPAPGVGTVIGITGLLWLRRRRGPR